MKRQSLEAGNSLIFLTSSITMSHDRSITEEPLKTHTNKVTATRKSQSIPLPASHLHRTQSELQLSEDMEAAERRDLNMFYRLVNGIRERQMKLVREHETAESIGADVSSSISGIVDQHGRHPHPHAALHSLETERSLAHIIYTRNASTQSSSYNQYLPDGTSTSGVLHRQFQPNYGVLPQEGLPVAPLSQPTLFDPLQRPGDGSAMLATTTEEEWSVCGFDQQESTVMKNARPYIGSQSAAAPTFPTEVDDGIFDFDL
jgi:hypothetical protein